MTGKRRCISRIRWAIFGVLFLCSGLSNAAPQKVTLWHSYRGKERAALEQTVADLNSSHADFQIELTFLPYSAYLNKINASVPRGNGPDLFIAAHDRIGGWADSGIISPVEGLLPEKTRERFFSKTIEPLVYKRKLYGLPTAFKSTALFYNRAMIKQAPVDTDQMLTLARKWTSGGDDSQASYGLVWNHSDPYIHACWLFGFKGQIFDSHGELHLDSKGNIKSVEFVRKLVASGFLPKDVDPVKVTTLFNSGRAAMVINGPWFRAEISKDIDYGVALLPQVSSSGIRARPFVGTEAVLLSAKAHDAGMAVRVMDLLTSDEAAGVRMRKGLQPVANVSLYGQQKDAADPALGIFRQQLKYAVPMSSSPEMSLVWEPLKMALDEAIAGRASAAQALGEAQRKASLRIKQYRQGANLKADTGGQEQLLQAVFWGVTGAVLVMLIFVAVFFKRFKSMLKEAWRQRTAYGYIGPAMLAIGLLVFVPFVVGLGLGFFRYYQGEYFYVGGQNFVDILSSREYSITDSFSFYYKLFITILWTGLNVFIHLAIGLGLALLLKDPLLKMKGLYRVLLIIPWAVPNYITAIIWRGMFDADDGVVNHLLGIEGFSWWQHTSTAFIANLVANCWLGFPFMMVISLGALQSIPKELYDAADVDGATGWQKFRRITLPLLKPALFPAIILGSIWTFNMFNIIYLVSRGAPNGGTDILVIEAFRWAFERGDRYGYAAAYSTLIFVILFLYTIVTNRISKATEGAFD